MPGSSPILIHVGRADIYVNVPVPVVPPVALSAADGSPLPPAGTTQSGGTFIGSTMGPASVLYRPTPFHIKTQQATAPVGYVTINEELHVEFELGELSYQNLVNTTVSRLDQQQFISLGGIIVPQVFGVLVVAPRRAGGFIASMLYQAAFYGDRNFTFNREGHLALRILAMAQAVTTRTPGDQLGYFHPNSLLNPPVI